MAGRHLIALWAVIATACTGRPTQLGAKPSWRADQPMQPAATKIGPVTFAPSSEPVSHYNEAVHSPPASALGDAAVAAVREAAIKANTQVPVADARLFRACSELAEVVPEHGVLAYSLVEFALHRNGIIEPSPHLLVVWGSIGSVDLIVDQLRPKLAQMLADGATARIGIGAARRAPDGTGAVVFALQASHVTTNPIPRAVPRGGAFTIEAAVDSRFTKPDVFVTRDSGATERIELKSGRAGMVTAQVACGARLGKQQVEITANDVQQGSTVLANFPVWCGTDPPTSLTVEPSLDDTPIDDPVEAERRLLAMVNQDRAAANLTPLVWDDGLATVSRGHSAEMQRTKVVAHLSPVTGSAADRVRVAKIRTAVVLENVARAYGLGEAHQGLMNSPGHRANVLSAAATHIGIGVVFGDQVSGRRELFITQTFMRVPPRLDVASALDVVRERLVAARPVGVNAKLQAIAQAMADDLARGKTRDEAYPAVRRQVDALGPIYKRVGSVVTAVGELEAVDGATLIGETRPDDVGIGLAQGAHPDIGDNAIWIVVLLAERR